MDRVRLIAASLLCALIAAPCCLAAPPVQAFGQAPGKPDAAASQKPGAEAPAVAAGELKVVGPSGQAMILKRAEFASLPHITLKARIHDKDYSFEGVELTGLLAKVGAPTGKDLRGPEVSEVVLATAADGYRLALSLVETDPRFRANRMIVADKMDGQPLNPHDGPFRLVVEGDLDAARLVRNLATIEVRTLD
jgi:Oxidoreductase molybdopterin binding domain